MYNAFYLMCRTLFELENERREKGLDRIRLLRGSDGDYVFPCISTLQISYLEISPLCVSDASMSTCKKFSKLWILTRVTALHCNWMGQYV